MFQMATLEGVLKTNAIDCQLNKNGNFFAPQKIKIKTSQSTTTTVTRGDKPYSKGCLYQKNCQYSVKVSVITLLIQAQVSIKIPIIFSLRRRNRTSNTKD